MPSIANIAAQSLQRRIVNGEFPVGSALPSQRELADQLAISRTSLREAVSTLEALGLVRSQPGKGVFVTAGRRPDGQSQVRGTALMTPRELIEFRTAVEPTWAALAALHSNAIDCERLAAIQAGMEEALRLADLVTAADYDLQFHLLLADLSRNPGLIAIAHQFSDQIAHSLRLPFSDPDGVWEPADEHRLIMDAINARDPLAASAAMRAHLAGSARRVGIDRFMPLSP